MVLKDTTSILITTGRRTTEVSYSSEEKNQNPPQSSRYPSFKVHQFLCKQTILLCNQYEKTGLLDVCFTLEFLLSPIWDTEHIFTHIMLLNFLSSYHLLPTISAGTWKEAHSVLAEWLLPGSSPHLALPGLAFIISSGRMELHLCCVQLQHLTSSTRGIHLRLAMPCCTTSQGLTERLGSYTVMVQLTEHLLYMQKVTGSTHGTSK